MPTNFPGPFEVRIRYVTDEPVAISDHEFRLSCKMSVTGDPGDPFSDWIPFQKDGSAVATLASHVDALMAFLRPFFFTATDFISAELWEYAPSSFDAIFRSTYPLSLSGTSGVATSIYTQSIITMRSQLGGIGKVDLRGTIFVKSFRSGFPTGLLAVDNMLAHMLAPSSIWVGRDNGYFMSGLFWLPGENEHAFATVNR